MKGPGYNSDFSEFLAWGPDFRPLLAQALAPRPDSPWRIVAGWSRCTSCPRLNHSQTDWPVVTPSPSGWLPPSPTNTRQPTSSAVRDLFCGLRPRCRLDAAMQLA
eukprot:scaffold1142_cov387-Prasinococcus_capsulatus_cf.AAC.17